MPIWVMNVDLTHSDNIILYDSDNIIFLFQEAMKNVKGFKELFARFLEETGPSVHWDKIKPPPEGSVSNAYMK